MTAHVAEEILSKGKTPDEAVATALAATSIGTASLGVALVVLGKLKLARFVGYLPMPVVSKVAAATIKITLEHLLLPGFSSTLGPLSTTNLWPPQQ